MSQQKPWRRASLRTPHGTAVPRQAPAKPRHGRAPTTVLGERRVAAGFVSQRALGLATGIDQITIRKLEGGKFPPNHPFLPRIARALGMSVEELQTFTPAAPMTEKIIHRLSTLYPDDGETRAPSTALVVATHGTSGTNGTGPVRRNKLKRLDDKTRQLARGLASAVNVARMQGSRYVSVNVPLPTDALAALLADYFALKGIKPRVLIEADFSEVFA